MFLQSFRADFLPMIRPRRIHTYFMLNEIQQIAIEAGEEILKYYGGDAPVDYKADDSPLTLADRAAHDLICRRLREFQPDVPVLSEESSAEEIANRREWKRFWLVDPLDGTKEFIKKSGEFTVNIALIVNGEARLGVIYVPAKKLSYLAEIELGVYKQVNDEDRQPIRTRSCPLNQGVGTRNQGQGEAFTIVASRDHAGPKVEALLNRYPGAEAASMGSSLKFCLVAEGKADVYLRDVPTMEWDTAAAQCIVETAGGSIQTLEGHPLTYNKTDLRNPSLLTVGDKAFGLSLLDTMALKS